MANSETVRDGKTDDGGEGARISSSSSSSSSIRYDDRAFTDHDKLLFTINYSDYREYSVEE